MRQRDRGEIIARLRAIASQSNVLLYRYGATGQSMEHRMADQSHSLDGFGLQENHEVLFESTDKEIIADLEQFVHDEIHAPTNRDTMLYHKYDPKRRNIPFRRYNPKADGGRYYLYVNWIPMSYRAEENDRTWAGNRRLIDEIIWRTKDAPGLLTVHDTDASYRAALDGPEMFAFSIAQQSGHLHWTTCARAWYPGVKPNAQTTNGRAKITSPRLGELIHRVRRLLADPAYTFPRKVHNESRWTVCDCVKSRFGHR